MVLFRDNETNNLNETTWLKIPTGMRRTSGLPYFTSVAEDLNLGLQGTNPASSQGRT